MEALRGASFEGEAVSPAALLLTRRVVAIAYEGANALDLFGALEPFSRAVELLNNSGPPPHANWPKDHPRPYRLSRTSCDVSDTATAPP